MSLQNLPEDRLYRLLPDGLISLDEQKLIQAVVGGYQDRVDDFRAYTSRFELLVTGQGLPESEAVGSAPNAVIAQVQSPKGRIYRRSLEIKDSTPAEGSAELLEWVAAELQLDEDHVLLSAAYGVDPLRLIDANVLPYLAATVGAVLYRSAALDPENKDSDSRRLLQTWFPRLQFKGTAESFETLGRLLGFGDVRMTPLWQRLSPRIANDIGDPRNDPDFANTPDFYPKQVRDNFYDPWVFRDGPYFTWSGTATARRGTSDTGFYAQVVNGFNPFISVTATGAVPTDPDPALSPYVLTGGGPETKAYVDPSGTGLRFEALSAGSSFNGLALHVAYLDAADNGTHRLLTVTDQLSAIKYRSSYYDLALALDFDLAEERFGAGAVEPSIDLQNSGTLANFGTQADSPYRPWKGGSMTQETILRDWLTEIDPASSQTVITVRTQAGLSDQQLNQSEVTSAGMQVVQAMEEVRPATRQPRRVNVGYLISDQAGYADYCSFGTLFEAVVGQGTYSGTLTGYPYPPYSVNFSIENRSAYSLSWTAIAGDTYRVRGTNDFLTWYWVSPVITATAATASFTILVGTPYAFFTVVKLTGEPIAPVIYEEGFVEVEVPLTHERDPFNPDYVRIASSDLNVTGTYDYSNSTWAFQFPNGFGVLSDLRVYANYQPTSTEVVREQPAIWPDPVVIAVTGDGGLYSTPQRLVNNLMRGWNPDAIFYTGDNSYYDGFPGELDQNMIYNQDFLDAKKFFPCPGNHDFYNPDSPIGDNDIQSGNIKAFGQSYRVYPAVGSHTVTYNGQTYTADQTFTGVTGVTTFTTTGGAQVRRRDESDYGWDLSLETNRFDYLPGNGRYYHARFGHVELFVVNAGYNTVGYGGFIDSERKPPEPDGNWCEAPSAPIGTGVVAPAPANPILLAAGGTYTVVTSRSYGDLGESLVPNYVVYAGGTYTNGQVIVGASPGPSYALAYGEPRLDPAPSWVVLRKARRYRVTGVVGSYVDYQGKRYYPGDVLQASLESDMTTAVVTGTIRLDRMNSTQAEQVKDWLARSEAPWKVVMYHQPNWQSDVWDSGHAYDQYPRLDWPWKEWGADVTLSGHVHAYARSLSGGLTRIIIGIGGQFNKVWSTAPGDYHDPDAVVEYATSGTYPPSVSTDYGAMRLTVTPTLLHAEVVTLSAGTVDTWDLTKSACVRAYQARPEDELGEPQLDLADEYPWRRDLVNGGELIDRSTYNPPTADVTVTQVGQSIAVTSQTGAQYDVTLSKPGPQPPKFAVAARSLSPYEPGQLAIAFSGTFRSFDTIDPRQREDLPRLTMADASEDGYWVQHLGADHSVDDLDWAMEPGWRLYHFGLVQGVLVADPVKFFGRHHRDSLVAWYPFNEHPRDGFNAIDHSVVNDELVAYGVVPELRRYDAQRGWHSYFESSGTLISTAQRPLSASFSASFWLQAPGATPVTRILLVGGLSVEISGSVLTVYGRDSVGATYSALVSSPLGQSWNFVGIVYDASNGRWALYQGDMTTAAAQTATSTNLHAWEVEPTIGVRGAAGGYYIHDLRVWSAVKTPAELELVRYHNPTPTACLYRPAFLTCVNDYDRYGVRVLDSGYVAPDLLPSSVDSPTEAWISRYDSTGQYQAQSRFKETGVGSGVTLPVKQQLGLQWDTLTAAGTLVVSTGHGGEGGVNEAWLFDDPAGLALQLVQAGSTIYGIPPTWISTGTSSPWPNALSASNPCRDRVWIEGDDNFVHEIKVARSGTGIATLTTEKLFTYRTDAELLLTGTEGTYAPILQVVAASGLGGTHCAGVTASGTIIPGQLLVRFGTDSTTDDGQWSIVPSGQIVGGSVLPSAGTYDIQTALAGDARVYHPASLLLAEQPTGAASVMRDAGYSRQLRVNTSGEVYAAPYAGTLYSPHLYLYGNEEVVVSASGTVAFGAWANPNAFGVARGVAALAANGEIAFEVDQTALSGHYRLEVTSGNIGQVDENFDGFKTVVTVGDYPFEARLCQGKSGADFTQVDTFDITLPRVLPGETLGYAGSWLLRFRWYNALRDTFRGTARQLAIHGFRLIRLNTTLYDLSVTATGTSLVEIGVEGTDFPATPGGWLAAMTSWGTAYGYTHESRIYSADDTYAARHPLSDVLTATTGARRQDLLMSAPALISDAPAPVLPSYGSIVTT